MCIVLVTMVQRFLFFNSKCLATSRKWMLNEVKTIRRGNGTNTHRRTILSTNLMTMDILTSCIQENLWAVVTTRISSFVRLCECCAHIMQAKHSFDVHYTKRLELSKNSNEVNVGGGEKNGQSSRLKHENTNDDYFLLIHNKRKTAVELKMQHSMISLTFSSVVKR